MKSNTLQMRGPCVFSPCGCCIFSRPILSFRTLQHVRGTGSKSLRCSELLYQWCKRRWCPSQLGLFKSAQVPPDKPSLSIFSFVWRIRLHCPSVRSGCSSEPCNTKTGKFICLSPLLSKNQGIMFLLRCPKRFKLGPPVERLE